MDGYYCCNGYMCLMSDELLNQFLFGDLDDKNMYVVEHFSVSNTGYLLKLLDWSNINQNI